MKRAYGHATTRRVRRRLFPAATTTMVRRAKQETEKILYNIRVTSGGTATGNEIVYTATYPGVIQGIRLQGTSRNTNDDPADCVVGVMIVREGISLPSIAISNGTVPYAPEQNVILIGTGSMSAQANGEPVLEWDMATKSKRKMQRGDRLVFFEVGNTGNIFHRMIVTAFMTN